MSITIISPHMIRVNMAGRNYYLSQALYVFLVSRSVLTVFLDNVVDDKATHRLDPLGGFFSAFTWNNTTQGRDYWAQLADEFYESQKGLLEQSTKPIKSYKEVI